MIWSVFAFMGGILLKSVIRIDGPFFLKKTLFVNYFLTKYLARKFSRFWESGIPYPRQTFFFQNLVVLARLKKNNNMLRYIYISTSHAP